MSLDQYMKKIDPDGLMFMGDKLEVILSRIYEKHRLIEIGREVTTIGVFEYRVGDTDKFHGFFLPAIITMVPSEVDYIKEGEDEKIKLTFYKGDLFLKSRKVVKNQNLAYVCFSLYFEDGKMPEWLPYDKRSFIFDTLKAVTGVSFPVDHAVFEIILSHLTRCPDDIYKEYRFSTNNKTPVQLKLKDVSHAADSFTARSISGNLADSINVMLTNKNTQNSDIEDLLRGNPQSHNQQSQ